MGSMSIHLKKLTAGKSYILTIHASDVPMSIVNTATKKTIINELITYSCSRYVLMCIQTSLIGVSRLIKINNIGSRNITTNINEKELLKVSSL